MTRPSKLLLCLLAVGLAAGCTDAPTATPDDSSPAFKGGPPSSGPTVSVAITATSPGILPDGSGPYVVTASSDGAVDVRPSCGSRSIDLQGMAPFIAGLSRSTCNGNRGQGYVFLKFPGIMNAATGACPDLDAPTPTVNALNFGVNSRYFFAVDSDGDGKFDDEGYTLVITDCMVTVSGNTRRVTASAGDLWQGQQGSGPVLSGAAFTVDLTITQ